MKTYYVNEVDIPAPIQGCVSDYNHGYIGLFTESNWFGKGDFCGWYGVECYANTTLIAFYQNRDKPAGVYNPKVRIGEVHRCNKHYDTVVIGSCYWERKITAESDDEAIRKFENMEF